MEGHRAGLEGDRRVTERSNATRPLRLLLSSAAAAQALCPHKRGAWRRSVDARRAWRRRARTSTLPSSLATSRDCRPNTRCSHRRNCSMTRCSLRPVCSGCMCIRPALTGRSILTLRERGVQVTTSSGANAPVVALSAVAGILALARRLPLLLAAQRERRWAPLFASELPRDLDGQSAVVVGWGPIGQRIGSLLRALGLRIAVARHSRTAAGTDIPTVQYKQLAELLPQADWLVLCCPLSAETRHLVDRGSARSSAARRLRRECGAR